MRRTTRHLERGKKPCVRMHAVHRQQVQTHELEQDECAQYQQEKKPVKKVRVYMAYGQHTLQLACQTVYIRTTQSTSLRSLLSDMVVART